MSTTVASASPSAPTAAAPGSLADLLFERLGWTPEFLTAFNDPSHPDLRDLDRIVEILRVVHQHRFKVVVMPDFDTDGVTSGLIAYVGLSQLGFNVELYIPDYRHGHDITPAAVADLLEKHPGAQVLLTTDAGTNSQDGVAFARRAGLTVLVTDHHQQLASATRLHAEVLINPFRLDEDYPHPGICGAHVIYQVVLRYAQLHSPEQLPQLNRLALFAGLGTVADVMPLYFENRDLVRRSLSLARLLFQPDDYRLSALAETIAHEWGRGLVCQVYVNAFFGFGQLLQEMCSRGKILDTYLREDLYGFYVAPAVNSARRILSDGGNAFRCFLGNDPAARAQAITAVLDDNERRKELSAQYLAELEDTEQPLSPYVWVSQAPSGMLGLLASSLSHDLDIPVAVVREYADSAGGTSYSGSARAPEGVDIVEAFNQAPGLSAVGHAQSCGVRAEGADDLPIMADLLCALDTRRDRSSQDAEFPGLIFGDTPDADATRPDPDELLELIERIAAVGPFGKGFPEPLHRVVLDPAVTMVSPLGKATYDAAGNQLSPAGKHTRISSLSSGLSLVWWNSALERESLPRTLDPLDDLDGDTTQGAASIAGQAPMEFLVRLSANTFNGTTRPQAIVQARLA